jgi:putative addiction module component (TIGR02574 family)
MSLTRILYGGNTMADTMELLKTQLSQLPQKQRAELAHFLLHTLDNGEEVEDEAAWLAELERRAAEIESGQEVGIPAEEAFAQLRKKYAS